MRLPLFPERLRLRNLASLNTTEQQHQLKFLVVDDNERWRRFMRSLFEKLGSVAECQDGDEAVAAFARQNPDWVLMDVEMPRMDGFTAARQIRNRFSSARIIFLSQHCDEGFQESAAGVGGQFISKHEVGQLQQLIEDGFFQRSSGGSTASA